MKPIRVTLALLTALISSSAAFGAEPADIRSQMNSGRFAEVCTEAEKIGTAEGFALAAECHMSEVILGKVTKIKKRAKHARELAKAGLLLDPSNQSAQLQYALTDGVVARETGDVSAWMKKLPQKTKVIVEAYRADFPTDPRGDALLGAWHLTIVRKIGDKKAQDWFGASVEGGRSLYEDARLLDPDDTIINVNFAFGILALDDNDPEHINEARDVLTDVAESQPADHLGRVLQGYAVEALSIFDDHKSVSKYARMFLDGKVPALPKTG